MLAYKRKESLSKLKWNHYPTYPGVNNSVMVLECWKFAGIDQASENENFRLLSLAREHRNDDSHHGIVEDKLERWIEHQDPYGPLPGPQGCHSVCGGLRLVLCDRANIIMGMTISQHAYLMVESHFGLHHTTIPSFLNAGGSHAFYYNRDPVTGSISSIQIVLKARQKSEVGNYTLSLSHDVRSGWTSAFLCGDGVILDRHVDEMMGGQCAQLLQMILGAPLSWDNPFFLPFVLVQNYLDRLVTRLDWVTLELDELETQIGVTIAGGAGHNAKREQWPQDIDARGITVDIHSLSAQIIYLDAARRWVQDCAAALAKTVGKVECDDAFTPHREDIIGLKKSMEHFTSIVVSTQASLHAFGERAKLQINVLFNIISQQNNFVTRQDASLNFRIARSSKQDSISMTTFTFITALFLPGTFVATLFSMTMFDWQSDSSNTTTSSSKSDVSGKFWIFWTIVIPLTAITMGSWFVWSRYANQQWAQEFVASTSGAQHAWIEGRATSSVALFGSNGIDNHISQRLRRQYNPNAGTNISEIIRGASAHVQKEPAHVTGANNSKYHPQPSFRRPTSSEH